MDLDISVEVQVPERVEMAASYVVAEALTNAAKHARASKIDVRVDTEDATLRLLIRDDGDSGADTAKGRLTGLIDRVEAHGGTMAISSPIGRGTSLVVKIPLRWFERTGNLPAAALLSLFPQDNEMRRNASSDIHRRSEPISAGPVWGSNPLTFAYCRDHWARRRPIRAMRHSRARCSRQDLFHG